MPAMGELLGGFLMYGLLWAAIPTFVCASIAGSRGLVAGPAIVLGLIGGWFGLAIVWAFYKPPLIEAVPPPRTNPKAGPAVGVRLEPPSTDDEAASRLRRLQQLRDEGLLTDTEFEERRQRVLETL
jgi:hypothetical protein